MRTIKFRAWDDEEKWMLWIGQDDPSDKNSLPSEDDEKIMDWNILFEHDFPVMQFTGLKDKNGREIYEGDYLKFTDLHGHEVDCTCEHCFRLELGTIAEVRWMDDGFMLVNPKASEDQCACAAMGRLFSENHEMPVGFYAEVIGNIYENPDSIKE